MAHIAMYNAADIIKYMFLEWLVQKKPSKLQLQRSCKWEQNLWICTSVFSHDTYCE